MKKIMSVLTLLICVCLAGAGVMPAFAEVTDFTEFEEWREASSKAEHVESAELVLDFYKNPKILEQYLACCPENTEENRKAAEEYIIREALTSELVMEYIHLTTAQKYALLYGNKEFEIATMPYIASDALFCLKKGENISAQDIRDAFSGWRFVLYVDGEPVAEGGVTMNRKDTPSRTSFYSDYVEDFSIISMGFSRLDLAAEEAQRIEAANQLGEIYAFHVSDFFVPNAYVKLDGDQMTFYESPDAMIADTPMTAKEGKIRCKAEYLNTIESCNDHIASAKGETVYSGADGKTAADFYKQAEFILYVRPWIIAGSVILGLAVVGTVVLVIVKKRKAAVK